MDDFTPEEMEALKGLLEGDDKQPIILNSIKGDQGEKGDRGDICWTIQF